VSSTGCTPPPAEHTVRKVTADDVRHDTEKAIDTAADAAAQAKEDFASRIKAGLEEMDVAIKKLEERGEALKDEAKARWNEKLAALKAKREAARQVVDELGTATGEAWERLEKGAQAAWDDVQTALQEALKDF
jgi:hypothetical protein